MMVQGKECWLEDDGTMDTVISVDGKTYRIGAEEAADYRNLDGGFSSSGFRDLCEYLVDSIVEEVEG